MRQRITVILTIVVILGLLVLVNTVTYVKEQKVNDSEFTANRSTYHSGPTGTRAFYDFLSESGHKVMRWREATEKLSGTSGDQVTTFVVIGRTQLPFTEDEATSLIRWVKRGGQLVLIDREFDFLLVPKLTNWMITSQPLDYPSLDLDANDTKQMTSGVSALKPVQPTLLTQEIQAVMPSRFSARIKVIPEKPDLAHKGEHKPSSAEIVEEEEQTNSPAPVVEIADRDGALVVDFSYGLGRITLLGDPYVVANNGIRLNDNLQLARNLVTNVDALVAFDEFHQGKGITQNEFASYFAGTPVLALAAQITILILLVIWTGARRFARPLPLVQVDRRSSLEFVASMSELQERSRAFDLAVENIYSRTRRVLARYAGVDYNSSRSEVAARVAMRSTLDAHSLETLMRQCEETINGAPTTSRQAIDLVRRLREVEKSLGLRMRSREIRQAAERI
jgi:voltage-gated potassium channel Kch